MASAINGNQVPRESSRPVVKDTTTNEKKERKWLKRLWRAFVFLSIIALTIALIFCYRRHIFGFHGDEVYSNSSRITVFRSSYKSHETILTLADVHAIFGFANYSCEPSGAIQFIESANIANIIGIQTTWYKILLRSTIENYAPAVMSLDPDGYTVTLTEPGAYLVNAMVGTAVPVGFSGYITTCTFVEVSGYGLFDVLRRAAFECNSPAFIGDPEFGPILLQSSSDFISITEQTKLVLRYIFVSDEETEVGVIFARLKVLKL